MEGQHLLTENLRWRCSGVQSKDIPRCVLLHNSFYNCVYVRMVLDSTLFALKTEVTVMQPYTCRKCNLLPARRQRKPYVPTPLHLARLELSDLCGK